MDAQAAGVLGVGPSTADFEADLLVGLTDPAGKHIPSKYFYDKTGSALFERITELDEYYLTRTEIGLLRANAAEMARWFGRRSVVVEYGAGSGVKTRILLDALGDAAAYVPIDISCAHLAATAAGLQREYPRISVHPVCADYTGPVSLPALPDGHGARVAFFPGSTVGNFDPGAAAEFLAGIRALVGPGGGLLLGTDLKKDRATLEAAYNDRAGVTAAFNLNLLVRANAELGADFDPATFEHAAVYDEARGKIDMFLVSGRAQDVHFAGATVHFERGERIHTEASYKFDVADVDALALRAGFERRATWVDDRGWFGEHFLSAVG